jgi:hypothetical protein
MLCAYLEKYLPTVHRPVRLYSACHLERSLAKIPFPCNEAMQPLAISYELPYNTRYDYSL